MPLFSRLSKPGAILPLVLRLPSVFAYWLATMLIFSIVRRRTNVACACCATLLPCLTGAFVYASEARPYALVLLFAMASFWFWQEAHTDTVSPFVLAGLTLSIASAVSVQYYGFLVVLPIATGEAVLFFQRRRLHYAVIFCLLLAATPMVFLRPYIAAVRLYATDFPTPINIATLLDTYWSFFGRLMVFGIIAAALMLLLWSRSLAAKLDFEVSLGDIPACEWAAATTYLLLPLVGWGVALSTRAFYPRYVLSTCLGAGILLGFALFLTRFIVKTGPAWIAITLALFASLGAVDRLRAGNHSEAWGMVGACSELLHARDLPPSLRDQPLVLGAGPYLISFRYADEDARRNYYYLVTSSREKGHVAVILRALHDLYPGHGRLITLDAFRKTHSLFNVYEPDEWFLGEVQRSGAHLSVIAKLPHGMVYRVEFT